MDGYGQTKLEAFVDLCRAKLPELTITADNALLIFPLSYGFHFRGSGLFRGDRLTVHLPAMLKWGEAQIKLRPQSIAFDFVLDHEGFSLASNPARSSGKIFIRDYLGSEKFEFRLPERAVELPTPFWITGTKIVSQWCFASERHSVVQHWANTYSGQYHTPTPSTTST